MGVSNYWPGGRRLSRAHVLATIEHVLDFDEGEPDIGAGQFRMAITQLYGELVELESRISITEFSGFREMRTDVDRQHPITEWAMNRLEGPMPSQYRNGEFRGIVIKALQAMRSLPEPSAVASARPAQPAQEARKSADDDKPDNQEYRFDLAVIHAVRVKGGANRNEVVDMLRSTLNPSMATVVRFLNEGVKEGLIEQEQDPSSNRRRFIYRSTSAGDDKLNDLGYTGPEKPPSALGNRTRKPPEN